MFGFLKKKNKVSATEEKKNVETKPPIQVAFERNLEFLKRNALDVETVRNLFKNQGRMETIRIGMTDFPSGEIVIADPLVYLGNERYTHLLNRKIPVGAYPIELAVCHSPIAGVRIAAARLKVREEDVCRYEVAMPKGTTIEQINEPGILAGFGVDCRSLPVFVMEPWPENMIHSNQNGIRSVRKGISMMIILQNFLRKAIKSGRRYSGKAAIL